MKNFFKILGIIAIAAVIGFSMAGCSNSGGSGSGDDDGGGGGGSGTWKITDSKLTNISAIGFGGGKFIAMGEKFGTDNNISYSTDGINWTAKYDGNLPSKPKAIAYGNGTFVVAGDTTSGGAAY